MGEQHRQKTGANPQDFRQVRAPQDGRRPTLERIAGRHKGLVERAVTLQSEKGELRKLVGWVERDADALEIVISIVRQHGGQAGKIYDRRYGSGIGPIWFRDGFRIDDCQFYFGGKLPVMRVGGFYTGLNAANIVPGNEEILVKGEKPGTDFCFGNANINTEGIRVRVWDRYDPATNTISWGNSVFAGERIGFGEMLPLQHFSPVPECGIGQMQHPQMDFAAQVHAAAPLHTAPVMLHPAAGTQPPALEAGHCKPVKETGRVRILRRRVRIRRRRRRRMDAEKNRPKPMKLRTEHHFQQYRMVFLVAEEKKDAKTQKAGKPSGPVQGHESAGNGNPRPGGRREQANRREATAGWKGKVPGLPGKQRADSCSMKSAVGHAGRREGPHGSGTQRFAARSILGVPRNAPQQGMRNVQGQGWGAHPPRNSGLCREAGAAKTGKTPDEKRRKARKAIAGGPQMETRIEIWKRAQMRGAEKAARKQAKKKIQGCSPEKKPAPKKMAAAWGRHRNAGGRRAFAKAVPAAAGIVHSKKAERGRKAGKKKAEHWERKDAEKRREERRARRDAAAAARRKKGELARKLREFLLMFGRRKRKKRRMWLAISRRE